MTGLLLDAMLGKLARYLRMCGYDAAYALDRGVERDEAILRWASDEDRTVVTRDRALAARADDALLLSSRAVADQLRELATAGYDLRLPDEPTRCGRCNGRLVRLGRDETRPPDVPAADEGAVWRCVDCDQHFWKGSHWEDVGETLAAVRRTSSAR